MSLADEPAQKSSPSPKPYETVTNSSGKALTPTKKGEKVVLREIRLDPNERVAERMSQKSEMAFKELVSREGAPLYKCPQYNCTYSSNLRNLFENHLNRHKNLNTYVTCFYCFFKMEHQHLAQHVTLRHGSSKYACRHCFYRAVSKDYVKIHYQQSHPEEESVEIVESTYQPAADIHIVNSIPLMKTVVLPFICGTLGELMYTDCLAL